MSACMHASSLAMPGPSLLTVIEALDLAASGCRFFRLYHLPGCSPWVPYKSRPGARLWVPPRTFSSLEKLGKAARHSSTLSHRGVVMSSTPSLYKMIRSQGLTFSIITKPHIEWRLCLVCRWTSLFYVCFTGIDRASGHLDSDTEETEGRPWARKMNMGK